MTTPQSAPSPADAMWSRRKSLLAIIDSHPLLSDPDFIDALMLAIRARASSRQHSARDRVSQIERDYQFARAEAEYTAKAEAEEIRLWIAMPDDAATVAREEAL